LLNFMKSRSDKTVSESVMIADRVNQGIISININGMCDVFYCWRSIYTCFLDMKKQKYWLIVYVAFIFAYSLFFPTMNLSHSIAIIMLWISVETLWNQLLVYMRTFQKWKRVADAQIPILDLQIWRPTLYRLS
jgi:hypothetical protein